MSYKYKTLLIDLDGTLLGSKKTPLKIGFIRNFIKRTSDIGLGPIEGLKLLHELRINIEKDTYSPQSIFERSAFLFSQFHSRLNWDSKKGLMDLIFNTFKDLERYFYQIPEAQKLISNLKNLPYRLVLATNPVWPLNIVKMRLEWAQIDPKIFDFIASAETMNTCKPHIRYYEELLEHLDATPHECLMIGDSDKKDAPCTNLGINFYKIRSRRKKDYLKLSDLLGSEV